jgi:hypothetical protein
MGIVFAYTKFEDFYSYVLNLLQIVYAIFWK